MKSYEDIKILGFRLPKLVDVLIVFLVLSIIPMIIGYISCYFKDGSEQSLLVYWVIGIINLVIILMFLTLGALIFSVIIWVLIEAFNFLKVIWTYLRT